MDRIGRLERNLMNAIREEMQATPHPHWIGHESFFRKKGRCQGYMALLNFLARSWAIALTVL